VIETDIRPIEADSVKSLQIPSKDYKKFPMSQDFFLQNRAHQINRLYGRTPEKRVQCPSEKNLARLPLQAQKFYATLDRICKIASVSNTGSAASLTSEERQLLEQFEKTIVLDRFAADEQVKDVAVQMIKAIFTDAEYFSGLKPLPQYNDKFAFELLFPSWLNLLSAVMLPRVGSSRARLDGPQQVEFFRFIADCPVAHGAVGDECVGFLTFIASRFDAPQCEQMLQRAIDLVGKHGEAVVRTLTRIDLATSDGITLKEHIGSYLISKYSLEDWTEKATYQVATESPHVRAMAATVKDTFTEMEAEDCAAFCTFAKSLATIVESKQPLSIEFSTALLKHKPAVPKLIGWVVKSSEPPKLLSESAQTLLVAAFNHEPEVPGPVSSRFQNFVQRIVFRAEGIGETAAQFFRSHFLDSDDNRHKLMDACSSEAQLKQMADLLIARATKTDSNEKFINLLSCASVLDQSAESLDSQVSLNALQSVIDNRSIGTKELSDIMNDLQKDPARAIQTLASPLSVAAEKTERLVTLYLTLNEVGQTLYHSGKVENFSVVRAKYSRLSNLE
jgi:hypothetical protein